MYWRRIQKRLKLLLLCSFLLGLLLLLTPLPWYKGVAIALLAPMIYANFVRLFRSAYRG